MKRLTNREEFIMKLLWEKGPLFVREMLPFFEEPQPHFNTVSTIVRGLEDKGYVAHKAYGPTHQYIAVVGEEEYGSMNINNAVGRYFKNSYLAAVSSLVKEEKLSLDDLKELIEMVKRQREKLPEK